jgi:glycine/D-amino acid oxidase-like deaminating enzyme
MAPHAEETTAPHDPSFIVSRPSSSLPHPSPSLSYWHHTTPNFPYRHHNSTTPVPSTSVYTILGSGLSGVLLAFALIHTHHIPASHILILEARHAVSGATGRNAGHVRPDAFRGFTAYERLHGTEQAKKILESERTTFEALRDFVKENGVDCDFEETLTRDVCLTEEFAREEAVSLEAFRRAGGDVECVKVWDDREVMREKNGVLGAAKAVYEWPAGSVHPAKLTQWLLKDCVEKGVRLWTHCAGEEVVESEDEEGGWLVQTPRGTVETQKVIHCTNAYAAYLLPELHSFVTPNRAQAHAFQPTKELKYIEETTSLRYGLRHFFSFIQRRQDDTVIFGTSRENPEWSQETRDGIVTFDDSSHNTEVAATAEREFDALFGGGRETEPGGHAEKPGNYWTGIIAMTPDSVPMVGPIDGLEGQYVCAGFNGHGMARIWSCSPGLAKLIVGKSWEATGLPDCFRYSRERVEKAVKKNLQSVW